MCGPLHILSHYTRHDSIRSTIDAGNAAKQDKIRTTSEITMDKLNINTHIINNGNFLQKGAVYFNSSGAFNSEVDLVVQTGSTVTARIASSGAISGQSLSYKDGAETVDVKTKVNQMSSSIQTLDDKLTGTITILSEDGGSYKLDEMLDIIVANKVKLDTFVQLAVDGATGDNDVGSVSLIEAVAQNKADVFTNATALRFGLGLADRNCSLIHQKSLWEPKMCISATSSPV